MAKVIWAPSALDDIASIAEYIAEDSTEVASLFVHRLIEATDRLQDQGWRTLNSFSRKNLEQEVIVPARNLNLPFDAVARWMPLEQADGKAAKPCKIVG